MKKYLIIILIILVGEGCIYYFFKDDLYKDPNKTTTTKVTTTTTTKPAWVDNNPISFGLYQEVSNKRIKTNEYSSTWTYHKDIIEVDAIFTNEEELAKKKLSTTIEEYMAKYENIDAYRIGYNISFDTTDGKVNKQILRPADTEEFFNYLEIYLYDAIEHKNDSWYSHTTDKQFNEKTFLEGIKLTSGVDVAKITSDITVKAFVYDNDDFDENNIYRGKCYQILTVKNN